ncbi:MAG: hypothetical protein HZC40_10155 [Chloroflexi bacterium]|nr:hypothetical protein [Chloroflexota bacterium]
MNFQVNNATFGIIGVLLFGMIIAILALRHMKEGFGLNNIRILGIIIVATFSSALALVANDSISAAIGILGAIAGYLFGVSTTADKN